MEIAAVSTAFVCLMLGSGLLLWKIVSSIQRKADQQVEALGRVHREAWEAAVRWALDPNSVTGSQDGPPSPEEAARWAQEAVRLGGAANDQPRPWYLQRDELEDEEFRDPMQLDQPLDGWEHFDEIPDSMLEEDAPPRVQSYAPGENPFEDIGLTPPGDESG